MNPTLQDNRGPSPSAASRLLYGSDPTEGIVAVELTGASDMAVTRRLAGGETVTTREPFRPWLLAARSEPWAALRERPSVEHLAGAHPLRYRVRFDTWRAFLDASQAGSQAGETLFRLRSPVEQYLVDSGRTLFKGMVFEDLRRLQLDIETLSLDPNLPESRIVAVAMRTSDGRQTFLTLESTEADLLHRVSDWLLAADPDVVEGHNVFNFDLPFLVRRATMAGLSLDWGRGGSPVRLGEGRQRFKAGALSLPFSPVWIAGRHVVDTYQQIQRYDVGGRLGSYALKPVIAALFPDREREVIPGDQIRSVWERGDLRRLEAYNLADVEDVDTLSRLALPTEFYQAQLVPRSLQAVATGGPGEKINDLMLRAYLHQGHSVPTAQPPRPYAGGHAELLATGAFSPVVKCDIESLYPSIMLADRVRADADVLDAALPMLADLTRRRLQAKARSRDVGPDRDRWEGLQGSFKVLINSFYGYLGYGQALFNDYAAAERVTLAGQRIIKSVVTSLEERGATPIEVDTDGVYFVPPDGAQGLEGEEAFVAAVGATLPEGIRLAHDGRYAAMLSLRLKTYALLSHDDRVVLKGSSLRNRRMERCFRTFLQDAARGFLVGDRDSVRERYFSLGLAIRDRQLAIEDLSQWGFANAETLAKQPRLKRLVDQLPQNEWDGSRLEVYERQDGELALAARYANDENVGYLLRRLRDCAERFRALFPDEAAFSAFFPPLSTRTDLAVARSQETTRQLGLFG